MRSIRRSSERRGGRTLALAITLASVTGCSEKLPAPIPSAHGDDTTPRHGGMLTSASFGDIRTIDPAHSGDGLIQQILQGLFAGLVDYDLDGKLYPDLAERWTVSEEGKAFTFVLRQGSKFHDGDEVTADDVKRSAERSLHPSAANPFASYFASIVGYAAFAAGKAEHLEGITVDGRYVVTFRLEKPDSAFLLVLAMHPLRPVCKSGGTRYVDTWQPCGAGPFKLLPGGWDRGRQITLVRHEGYFRPGLPYLDAFRYVFHSNPSTQLFKFERGEQDVLRDFLSPDIVKFQSDPRWKRYGAYEVEKQISGIAMNTEMAPFDNVEIRRAVAAALDREQLSLVRPANLRAANQPIPPALPAHDPTFVGQTYDLAAALEHMRRAGYPYDPFTKTGGWPHVIPYLTYAQGLDEYLVQVSAQMLARIGLRLEVKLVNFPTFLALRARRGEVAIGFGFWGEDYPEAGSILEPLFHSRSINDEDSNNWSFYKNPRVDELIDRARHAVDAETQVASYRQAQTIICDDAPWAFTYFYRFYAQWNPYVHDYRPHPTWTTDATRTWVDRAAGAVAARALFSGDAMAKLLGDGRGARP